MDHNYCTLFNMAYWPKWYVMYRSWLRWAGPEDVLYVLPMDWETEDFLEKHGPWRRVEILKHRKVMFSEGSKLDRALESRDVAYQCFTMAPWLCHHLLFERNLADVTYLDADLWFTSTLAQAWNETPSETVVSITPHRFHPEDAVRLRPSGLFNVSWVTFKNDPAARAILRRWAEQALAKCDAESCGDQKYLDEWPQLLGKQLHQFQHEGIGVAPWNARSYRYDSWKDSRVPFIHPVGQEHDDRFPKPVVFYHFHELKRKPDGTWRLTGYQLPTDCIQHIYTPYLQELEAAYALMEELKRHA